MFRWTLFAFAVCWMPPAIAAPGDIVVHIHGATTHPVLCALFESPDGFPNDAARARKARAERIDGVPTCRWSGVESTPIAVAVFEDLNRDDRLARGAFGQPKEPWGVTRNAAPAMRAPRFAEAAITPASVPQPLTITLRR